MTKKVSKKKQKIETQDSYDDIDYDVQQWSDSDVKELLEETYISQTYNYSKSFDFNYD